MNIRNCVLKTALAFAAFALPPVTRAAGNIYEIRPVSADGTAIDAPTANLMPGEYARFVVRLMKNEINGKPFGLVHIGPNSENLDWVVNPPKIGIWVSGERRFATLESTATRTGEGDAAVFTDLIFAYQVKPGDFALPIRLAGSDGSMMTPNSSSGEYFLDFRATASPIWDVRIVDEASGAQANFVYGVPFVGASSPDGTRTVDYDLSGCNFNVQTIDFDESWEDAAKKTVWRTVHQGSTEIANGGLIPSLHALAMPTNNAYTLYLWSEDESVFRMPEGANCTQRDIHVTSDTTETRWVRAITVMSGKQDYTFDLEGVTKGATAANLVLSAFPDFNYSAGTSARLADYVTVPVVCGDPAERSVSVVPANAKVTATSEYTHYVTELRVTFNQAFTEDVEIEIEPSIQDPACPHKWWDYIRFSDATDEDVTLQANPGENPKVTIKAGSRVTESRLYIYALRSDEYVHGLSNHILFTPKTANATAQLPVADGGIKGWDTVAGTGLNIDAQNPSIDSMFDEDAANGIKAVASAIADSDCPLTIVVSDTYADMTCTNGGYEVWVKKDKDGVESPINLDGLFLPGKGGVLFRVGTTDVRPTLTYTAAKDVYNSYAYVKSPISGNVSANHDFTINVSAPQRVVATVMSASEAYPDGDAEFAEGESVQLKISLQDDKGNAVKNSQGDLYVYIQGETAEDNEAIDCTWKATAGGKGRKLGNYSDSVQAGCTLELIDGDGSKLGAQYAYNIVLLTEPTWTDAPAARVTAYKNNEPVVFTVRNVIPSVEAISVNGGNYEVREAGATIGPFPINVAQTFAAVVTEPGTRDKTATGDEAFRVRWRFVDPYGSPETLIVSGNPDETVTNYTFAAAGDYTVEVDLSDKDMLNRYGNSTLNQKFSFKVRVIDQPAITLEHDGPYNETESVEAGGEAKVTVKLGLNACDFDMYVKLLIAPNATGSAAPGLFKLQSGGNVTANGTETFAGEEYDSYTVRFPRRSTEMPIFVQSMDGTLDSRTTGFKAVLTNLTETVVPNSGGKRACDYYVGSSPAAIKVNNVAPILDETVDVYPVPGTNAINTAIGQVDEAITWSFSDVVNDFTRGITVEFKGGGGWGPNTYYTLEEALAAGAAGFRPTFTTSGKGQTVRLIIKDPDGGVTPVVWTYDVEAAKSMTLAAHGPSTGYGAAKGDRYNTKASGLGEGRVWAASKSAIAVDNWISTVNCGLEKSFMVYGYGYKVGDVDGGTGAVLHYPDGRTGYQASRDTPIDPSGANIGAGTEGYRYEARLDDFGNPVDSFLYTWLLITTGEDAGGSVTDAYLNETTAPEQSEAKDAGRTVTLPTEEAAEGGYATTRLEAVFSIEKYASDNMGDINQDGIPDLYAKKYDFGVYDASTGAVTGDDLKSLTAFDDDEDYLPDGTKFTAELEIRGFGHGLNDAPTLVGLVGVKPDRVYTDPDADAKSTLSKAEYLAWLEYAQANNLDPALKDNWTAWSPECPTDPANPDTDEDGFSDGFEYYYWYRATVGYLDVRAIEGVLVTNHLYETGRRFDPRNPGEGTLITSAEIARLMNPRIASGDAEGAAARDSDNDGLTDLEEYALGTNPFDFDTDGDGLPDGYEVLIGTDPTKYATDDVLCDAARNFDGDHMAYTSLFRASSAPYCGEYLLCGTEGRPTDGIQYLTSFAVLDPDGDSNGVQWYVVKAENAPQPITTNVTENIVTCEIYDGTGKLADGASWTKVAVRAATLSAVDAGTLGGVAVKRLSVDVEATEAFLCDEADDGTLVRGLPKRLTKGTLVRNEADAAGYAERRLAAALAEDVCNAAWVYGNANVGVGDEEASDYGELAIARHAGVAAGAVVVGEPLDTRKVAYLHSYVYQEFGFDPRTAWNSTTPLAARWGTTSKDGDGSMLEDAFDATCGYAGISARTRPYTTYDEFLLMSYYLNSGCIDSSDVVATKTRPWQTIFSLYTTNPRGPGEPVASASSSGTSSTNALATASLDMNGADTDGDGVPDGWELYVMSGPKETRSSLLAEYKVFNILGPEAPMSPTRPDAGNQNETDTLMDADGMNERREFAGTDSCAAYAEVSATVSERPAVDASWLNKFFPTDPWNSDTDGDGVSDSFEGSTFVYGTPADGLVSGKYLTSIPGGGLNPCSVDTDLDGLPDGWEAQFRGSTPVKPEDYADIGGLVSYAVDAEGAEVGNCLGGYSDGMDGTVADACTSPVIKETSSSSGSNTVTRAYIGPTIATAVNRDYDHDGLENWQEYMVGAMRCWRYDDPFSRWDYIPRAWYWDAAGAFNPDLAALGCADLDEFWHKTLVDKTSPLYNPQFVTDQASGAMYFSRVENTWDCAYRSAGIDSKRPGGAYYIFKDRCGGEFIKDFWSETIMKTMGFAKMSSTPAKYISCDPTKADTDQDGMDDYYELFHGLNPLLGASGRRIESNGPCDVVYDAWYRDGASTQTAGLNVWTKTLLPTARGPMDFQVFPFLAGAADADPDGDDIRNQVEALMPEVGTDTWLHTDPTPLWMTDSSYTNSLVSMFWRLPARFVDVEIPEAQGESFTKDGVTYYFRDFDGYGLKKTEGGEVRYFASFLPDAWKLARSNRPNWMFSFEENEGYDTDHDGLGDYAEKDGKFNKGGSDPRDFGSPVRRQAMYFQGPAKPSLLQSLPYEKEVHPVGTYTYPDDMSFLQYTIECWVCPESRDDATILERVIWSGASNVGDEEFLRRNFQLAIKDGKWYTCFDPNGTLANNQVEVYSPTEVVLSAWTHLAATYDGKDLVLYVNGEKVDHVTSGLQPEYGSSAICVRAGKDGSQTYWADREYAYKALLVGASAKGRGDLGGNAYQHLNVLNAKGFDRYKSFFKGYVDEIRIWDGARSGEAISRDQRTRYTATEAKANRDAFYADWLAGRTRYAKDANGNDWIVTPELRYHYSFDSVFGGANEASVARVPQGFGETGDKAPVSRPAGYEVAWWKTVLSGDGEDVGYGSVYSDASWVTWIPNTVTHLPRYDGTTLDSIYWSADFKGALVGVYKFANTAEPVSRWTQMTYNDIEDAMVYQTTSTRHRRVNDLAGADGFATLFEFTGRHLHQIGDDLLPLGGAYAKYCPASIGFWDGQGASSTWAVSGRDSDNDGLPDWWEAYAEENYRRADMPSGEFIGWDTIVDYDGLKIKAGEAYLRDLARGAHPDVGGNAVIESGDYAQTADTKGVGIPDWWTELYGLQGESAFDDHDNDGLCNLVEYMLSEKFDIRDADGNRVRFDPTRPCSARASQPDYFYPIGSLYVGEIFSDHDFIEDAWERQYDSRYASTLEYNATTDNDDDGWSEFAEARYAQQVSPIVADGKFHYDITSGVVPDYPIPAVQLKVKYTGSRAEKVEVSSIGVRIGRDLSAAHSPDATYRIQGAAVVNSSQSGSGVTDTSTSTSVAASNEYKRLIGKWSNRRVYGTLTPGFVKANSIRIQTAFDPSSVIYSWKYFLSMEDGPYYARGTHDEYLAARNKYVNVSLLSTNDSFANLLGISVRTDLNSEVATLSCEDGQTLGTVNLKTGEYAFDLGIFKDGYVIEGTNTASLTSLEDQTYRIVYQTNPSTGLPRDLYLGEADSGYIREGANQIMVWADLNKDDEFTVGEPFGYVRDVDISWRTRAVEVELFDQSPILPRINMLLAAGGSSSGSSGSSASSDETADRGKSVREYCDGLVRIIQEATMTDAMRAECLAQLEWVNANAWTGASLDPTSVEQTRVRIVRWLVDGQPIYRYGVKPETVVDQKMLLSNRAFLTEADVLATGALDLDWAKLNADVVNNFSVQRAGLAVTNVAYLVVIGDGKTYWDTASETNSSPVILDHVIERRYDFAHAVAEVDTPRNEGSVVYAARPTFKWTIPGEDDSAYTGYTAFQIQVLPVDSDTPVWDSGVRRLPPRDSYGRYVWTAPAYAGDDLEKSVNYRWRVAVLNAKFSKPDWKAAGVGYFRMEPVTFDSSYGKIRACVRYFGPTNEILNVGTVRVEAFESPDFTGDPVARAALPASEGAAVTSPDAAFEAQVELLGVPRGTYYLRAYIDSDEYGTKKVRDAWESWGYLCDRSGATAAMFAPVSVTLDDSAKSDVALIYIEDTDTNGNRLPDAYEMHVNGGSLDNGTENLDETLHCGLAMKGALTNGKLNQTTTGDYSGLIAHYSSVLQTRALAALALGVPASSLTVDTNGRLAVDNRVSDVEIVSAVFENGKIALKIVAKSAASDVSAAGTSLYGSPALAARTVTCKVLRTETLAPADWVCVLTRQITVGSDPVLIDVPEATAAAGFYKVVIEE